MLATSQGLADATASAKVAALLALTGFFAGLMLTVAGGYLALPPAAKALIPPAAVLQYELARVPYVGPAALPTIAAMRPEIQRQAPTLHAAFDAIPGYALLGALAGMFMLPIAVSYLKTTRLDRRADAGRINPVFRR